MAHLASRGSYISRRLETGGDGRHRAARSTSPRRWRRAYCLTGYGRPELTPVSTGLVRSTSLRSPLRPVKLVGRECRLAGDIIALAAALPGELVKECSRGLGRRSVIVTYQRSCRLTLHRPGVAMQPRRLSA